MNDKFQFNSELGIDTQVMSFLQWVLGLYQLGQNTTDKINKKDIFNEILTHIVQGFDADTGSLAFLTADRQSLHLVAGIDLPVGVVGSKVLVNECRMGAIIKSSEPHLFNDIHSASSRVSSAMCWPLISQKQVLGALNINRGKERLPYTRDDLKKGKVLVDMISVVLENTQLHNDYQLKIEQLESMYSELKAVNYKLDSVQSQLLQSEKLASIGQLAAGVAHEINNPVGFINSNIGSLNRYVNDLFKLIDLYENIELKSDNASLIEVKDKFKNEIDFSYLKDDIQELLIESQDGVSRVKQIVQDLKDFSQVGEVEWSWVDLHQGINATLNIAQNEFKYKATIAKNYTNIPMIECMPSQLNQVFMSLIVNASHAITKKGVITVSSGTQDDMVWISVADNGEGMSVEVMTRIFEPFYTTKPVGKGAGLGLSLAYGIIESHNGSIEVESEQGVGSCFTLWLPINQKKIKNDRAAGCV